MRFLPAAVLSVLLVSVLLLAACSDDDADLPTDPTGEAFVDTVGLGFVEDIDVAALVMNPPVDAETGYRGFAYIKDQWCSGRVPGARILFVSEDGRYGFNLRADQRGEYALRLWPGRYKVYAFAPGYRNYSTCCGYFVFTGGSWQQGNIPLVPLGPVCSSEGTYAGRDGYDPAAWADRAPTARIEAEPEVARVGEAVTIRVTGEDDHGLVALWYSGSLGCAPACGRAVFADCAGANPCTGTWQVSFDRPGRYVVMANARDDAYPDGQPHQASEGLGMGCVEIVVTE